MFQRIVVGFDGTDTSFPALAWAATEARMRGSALEVITAWSRAQNALAMAADEDSASIEAHQDAERADVEQRVRAVIAADGAEGPELVIRFEDDAPAHALAQASAAADMVVIGSRGLAGAKGQVLGSVGQQLIEIARCPLVIIPPKGRARATEQFSADELAAARAAALGETT